MPVTAADVVPAREHQRHLKSAAGGLFVMLVGEGVANQFRDAGVLLPGACPGVALQKAANEFPGNGEPAERPN